MQLKPYLKTLPNADARDAFAIRCGTTIGHLTNVSNGKSCSTELAVAIERESRKQVTREEMCPENWRARWPELVRRKTKAQAGQGA